MKPILGIDFGQARIGVAISDELGMLAHPLETVPADNKAIARIAELAKARGVERVVVGIPRTMKGEVGTAATAALEFVEKLEKALPCPVTKWDERLTTVAAERALRDAGKKTRETRGYIDQVAAQMILQGYLDSKAMAAPDLADDSPLF